MAASSPEPRRPALGVLLQAMLAGAALGVLGLAGGSVVLWRAQGLLSASTGLVAALTAALLVGMWAGAPAAPDPALALRRRWLLAGVVTGVGGAFATALSLDDALLTGAPGRVAALFFLVAAPCYALGLLLPALAARAEQHDDDDEAAEWQPGWGMLGVVVAGVMAGLGVGVVAAGLGLLPWLGAGPLLLGLGALLVLPSLLADAAPPAAEEQLLYEANTPFGTLKVVEASYPGERQPERRLLLNDEEESGELVRSGAPVLAYIAAAERWLGETAPATGAAYLFLGGGAYTLPRRVAERDPRARITVVELDPEVTRIAYRFFGVRREHGLQTRHGDARAFAETAPEAAYDRIYLDVYTGGEAIPFHLGTREAFLALQRLLRPGGWLAINVIGTTTGPEARRLWSLVRTVADVFPTLALYAHLGRDYPERQNLLLAAASDAAATPPPRAGLFELWPRAEWPDDAQAVVYRDLLPAAEAAPRESARVAER